jgi:hypothetical protein
MPTIKIEQGAVYANAHDLFAREVIEIRPDGNVIYNDYVLNDGAPLGRYRLCSLGAFVRWVVRPLAPNEISALRRHEGQALDRAMSRTILATAIEAASDELILHEFYRRGLDRFIASNQSAPQAERGLGHPETETDESSRGRKTRTKRK